MLLGKLKTLSKLTKNTRTLYFPLHDWFVDVLEGDLTGPERCQCTEPDFKGDTVAGVEDDGGRRAAAVNHQTALAMISTLWHYPELQRHREFVVQS